MALREVCIAARDFGPGRAQAGDLIAIREPLGGIGAKEGHDFIWLLVDESELPDPSELRGEATKNRYRLPLQALVAQAQEAIDLARVQDPDDHYQPFLDTDPATGMHRRQNAPLQLRGHLIDREPAP